MKFSCIRWLLDGYHREDRELKDIGSKGCLLLRN
jgi:hypothetical protein